MPVHHGHDLVGFVFFDGMRPDLFTEPVRAQLWPYVHLIAMMMINEIGLAGVVRAAANTVLELARYRDPETAAHLQRMAHFARIMATALAGPRNLSDEFVEYLFWFAPLHDIGKVGVADSILLKPGPLTPLEYTEMKRHVEYGIEIVEHISSQFDLSGAPHIGLMRNIVACHHENFDGSGYPAGLAGDEIPIEGRITAVADVFDALTSERPYKKRWSNEAALDFMNAHRGTRFDPDCVAALAERIDQVETVQSRFAEEDI